MATGNPIVDALDALAAEVARCTEAVQAANPDALTRSVDQAASRAVTSIKTALNGASDAVKEIQKAALDTAQAASGVVQQVAEVRTATRWLNLRSVAVLALAVVLVVSGSIASIWWERHEFHRLHTRVIALRAEVQTERTNLKALKAKGARVKWQTCGGHLCFEASSDQHGGWVTTKGNIKLVIPRGY